MSAALKGERRRRDQQFIRHKRPTMGAGAIIGSFVGPYSVVFRERR